MQSIENTKTNIPRLRQRNEEMLPRNDLESVHNFFQLLMLWINHVMLSLNLNSSHFFVKDVVIRFDIQLVFEFLIMTCLQMFQSSDSFSSQHSLLLNCHCRFIWEHQSSNLGNVVEFPNSIMQQTSASRVFVFSHVHTCRAFPSKQITNPIRAHVHLQRCIGRLSHTRKHSYPVLHQVSAFLF